MDNNNETINFNNNVFKINKDITEKILNEIPDHNIQINLYDYIYFIFIKHNKDTFIRLEIIYGKYVNHFEKEDNYKISGEKCPLFQYVNKENRYIFEYNANNNISDFDIQNINDNGNFLLNLFQKVNKNTNLLGSIRKIQTIMNQFNNKKSVYYLYDNNLSQEKKNFFQKILRKIRIPGIIFMEKKSLKGNDNQKVIVVSPGKSQNNSTEIEIYLTKNNDAAEIIRIADLGENKLYQEVKNKVKQWIQN